MNENEIVKAIMKEKGVTPKMLAMRLGETHNTILARLAREHWTIGVLMETLRVLDYKITIVPADTREKKGNYTIDYTRCDKT